MKTAVIITGRFAKDIIDTMSEVSLGCIDNNLFFHSKKEAKLAIEQAYFIGEHGDTVYLDILTEDCKPNFQFKKVYKKSIDNCEYLQKIFS